MCFSELKKKKKKDTCIVPHSENGEENLRIVIARRVAISPGDFEVNFKGYFFSDFKS